MQQAIAYYRVSTARQGRSGLGLEAQQAAVRGYLGAVAPLMVLTLMFAYGAIFPTGDSAAPPIRNMPGFAQDWFFNVRAALQSGGDSLHSAGHRAGQRVHQRLGRRCFA